MRREKRLRGRAIRKRRRMRAAIVSAGQALGVEMLPWQIDWLESVWLRLGVRWYSRG